MDDATNTIYSAFLVEEEGTISTFRALLEVFTVKGLPASLYTDRGSHYFFTPRAGEAVDAAYSPEARGRSERMSYHPSPAEAYSEIVLVLSGQRTLSVQCCAATTRRPLSLIRPGAPPP
jgi:hypothetical protein